MSQLCIACDKSTARLIQPQRFLSMRWSCVLMLKFSTLHALKQAPEEGSSQSRLRETQRHR